MPNLRFHFLIFLSLVTALLIQGCARKTEKISLGYVSSGLTGLAVKVMVDNKIPEKYGIEFDYQGFPNPTSLNTAFILGKHDVNLAAGANVVAYAIEQGHDLVYFFPTLVNSVSLVVRKTSPYATLLDLKGKKIGWYGWTSGGGSAFHVLGIKKGINVEKQFQLVESSPPALWPLLDRGEVEAIIIFEPFVSKMLATNKYRSILGPFWQEWEKETGLKLEMSGLATSRKWFNNNQEKVKRVISVWKETANYIKDNTEKVIRQYPDLTDLRDSTEIRIGLRAIPPIYVTEWDSLDISIETMLKVLITDEVNSLITKYPMNMIQKIDSH